MATIRAISKKANIHETETFLTDGVVCFRKDSANKNRLAQWQSKVNGNGLDDSHVTNVWPSAVGKVLIPDGCGLRQNFHGDIHTYRYRTVDGDTIEVDAQKLDLLVDTVARGQTYFLYMSDVTRPITVVLANGEQIAIISPLRLVSDLSPDL